jgi:hypothetical protein
LHAQRGTTGRPTACFGSPCNDNATGKVNGQIGSDHQPTTPEPPAMVHPRYSIHTSFSLDYRDAARAYGRGQENALADTQSG